MKRIIKCLVLLLVLTLVGCGGTGGAKNVKIDPKEFVSLTYDGEYEGSTTPIINVDENKLNELVSGNIEYLMKTEFKDQYDEFKSMGYDFRYSDAFMFNYDRNQTLKNGDEIKVTLEPCGSFSDYEISDILSKANISMPESVSFKVEGLLQVTTVDFSKGKDLNKFMKFAGADGQGKITFDENYGLGDFQVQDSEGRTYYITEDKAEYEGDRTFYNVVVDNRHIGTLQPNLIVEEFKGVKEDYAILIYDPQYHVFDTKAREFEDQFSNGDKVHVDLYGFDIESVLASMGVVMENTTSSHTITEFGAMDDTINNININQVLDKFEEYARGMHVINDDEVFANRIDNIEIYKATLKPSVDKGELNENTCFIVFYQHHNEYEDTEEMTYFYNIYNTSDGSIDGEWGELSITSNDPDYLFGDSEKSARLEIIGKYFDLEKIY